jgi:hypothetical protein
VRRALAPAAAFAALSPPLIALLACAPAVHAATIRVPEDVASLSAALAGANAFDTVLVAPGTYTGTFVLPSAVTLRGAGARGATVIDAAGAGAAVACVDGGASTRLERVRLTNGSGRFDSGSRAGGALFVDGGSISLAEVDIDASTADLGGGALFVDAFVVWNEGLVLGNAGQSGGGVAIVGGSVELADLVVEGNTAVRGGGVSITGGAAAVIARTRFDNAAPGGDGSGLHLEGASAVVSDSRFAGEHAERGGGVFLGPGAYLAASFTSWFGCRADAIGGAVYATCEGGAGSACAEGRFTHCDFLRNEAPEAAAGAADGASRLVLEASAVAGNLSGFACADPRAVLSISCTAFGAIPDLPSPEACASASDTLVADPRLCDLAGGDTRRCANSPLLAPAICALPFYGAEGGGCAACGPTPALRSTWGSVKARYR